MSALSRNTEEVWREVVGWEGFYEVSDRGNVRSVDRVITYSNGSTRLQKGKNLKPYLRKNGYTQVGLRRPGAKPVTGRVHQMVMESFVGPPPEGMEVCHNNGDRYDNRLENLRYGTTSENTADQVKHGVHHVAARELCPRGHPLVDPNLMPSQKLRGARNCLACNRAHGYFRFNPDSDGTFQEESDRRYQEIISMEVESTWFAEQTGARSKRGAVTYTTKAGDVQNVCVI